jgi:plastocyanin
VQVNGPITPRPAINTAQDPKCKELGPIASDDVVVHGSGLAEALVYVKNVPGGVYPRPSAPVVLDQRGCMYHPKMLGIMTGQKLEIINSDPTLHNIHAQAKRGEFNVGMPTQGQVVTKDFKKPEIVPIKCDVHPWMHAMIGVFDHPFFAVTDAEGHYAISGLPVGEFDIVVFHPVLGEQTSHVKVSSTAEVDFAYNRPGL